MKNNDFLKGFNDLFGTCNKCNKFKETITTIMYKIKINKNDALEEIKSHDFTGDKELVYINKLEKIIRDIYYTLKQLKNI